MSRVRLGLALLSLVAGCGPLAAGSAGSSPVGTYTSPVDDPGPVHTSSGVEATGNDNFAAMDEVPVAGGELRLAAPRRTQDASGAVVTAIMFPLRHTDVQTKVSGMSALYTVAQTFENPYDEPIDAVYVFPLGDEAAITSYAIVIGDRTIAGEIKQKQDARAAYEEARAQGHTAALLEQDKRNIFRQRIANIAPRETIEVRMQYIELLGYRDGEYEIAFPLVVGPRYLPAGATGTTPVGAHHAGQPGRPGVTSIPYADARIAGSTVRFTADVDAGVPVLSVSSPSHQLQVDDVATTRRRIALASAGELPNRDIIVRYRTASEQTMVGVLAHRRAATGYFTLILQPKASYRTGDITPREVMIVIDTSGSMDGPPLAQASALARALIDSLRPTDTFNVTGETVSQITELGLKFHMVTDYTSFVAVDRTRIVAQDGASRIIEQPALAPAGVNLETAIGPPAQAASYASSPSQASELRGGGGGGWGGHGGGGDVDLLTLALAVCLIPLAWTLRRIRA